MEHFKKQYENQVYYNPRLLITGVIAGAGGLLILSLIAWLWTSWVK